MTHGNASNFDNLIEIIDKLKKDKTELQKSNDEL